MVGGNQPPGGRLEEIFEILLKKVIKLIKLAAGGRNTQFNAQSSLREDSKTCFSLNPRFKNLVLEVDFIHVGWGLNPCRLV